MDTIRIAKKIVSIVVGAGTATIVRQIIENNVDTTDKPLHKVTVTSAGIAIGIIAANESRVWTDRYIDALVEQYYEFVNNIHS